MARIKIAKTLIAGALLCVALFALATGHAQAAEPAVVIPPPALDETAPAGGGLQTVVLAGGCFWGVQAVYEHTKGVTQAVSGYSGGPKETAHYEMVGTGRTGHAESVSVTYDPQQISLRQDFADLFFGRAQSDRAELSGARQRPVISLGDLLCQ